MRDEGWSTDAAACSYIGLRIRRPIPPPFCDLVDVVGQLPVTVEDAPYRPLVHVSVGEGEFYNACKCVLWEV